MRRWGSGLDGGGPPARPRGQAALAAAGLHRAALRAGCRTHLVQAAIRTKSARKAAPKGGVRAAMAVHSQSLPHGGWCWRINAHADAVAHGMGEAGREAGGKVGSVGGAGSTVAAGRGQIPAGGAQLGGGEGEGGAGGGIGGGGGRILQVRDSDKFTGIVVVACKIAFSAPESGTGSFDDAFPPCLANARGRPPGRRRRLPSGHAAARHRRPPNRRPGGNAERSPDGRRHSPGRQRRPRRQRPARASPRRQASSCRRPPCSRTSPRVPASRARVPATLAMPAVTLQSGQAGGSATRVVFMIPLRVLGCSFQGGRRAGHERCSPPGKPASPCAAGRKPSYVNFEDPGPVRGAGLSPGSACGRKPCGHNRLCLGKLAE